MDNGLIQLMKYYTNQQNADGAPKYTSGVVLSVAEDYSKADVELAQKQVCKELINKSGEELTVGDTVWVEYFTYPSSGWISRRNGEPKPLGGGGGARVQNATILDNSNFQDYNIVEQMNLDISSAVSLYYGNLPNFICFQGNYGLLISSTVNVIQYQEGSYVPLIDNDPNLYSLIVANKSKFGVQYGNASWGGWYYGNSTSLTYPDKYIYTKYYIYRLNASTWQSAPRYQYMLKYQYYIADTDSSSIPSSGEWWNGISHSSTFATTAPDVTWYMQDYDQNITTQVSTKGMSNVLYDYFLVPCVTDIYYDETSNSMKTPFGYTGIVGWLLFSSSNGVDYGVQFRTSNPAGGFRQNRIPFRSEAEKVFSLGLSKRTEPVLG